MPLLEPQVEQAVQRRLQGNPPFSDADFAQLDTLAVLFPCDLGDLARFPMLSTLHVVGFGGCDLAALAGHPRLASLSMRFSALADVSAVLTLPMIRRLQLPLNAIEDISALRSGLPKLREVDLTGNPLSEESYCEVVPELRQRVRETVTVSEEREWQITRRLYAAGVPFDYFRHGDTYLLCRPGLAFTGTPDAGHAEIGPDELEAVLQRGPEEVHKLFAREAG
ncbi:MULTISPECIES: leucine-rich repeat domain-containing protein [Thermomonosporaceae]|uniref:leucine-rich repeat domain-containing protein n=1 Tax=Thermomonosporaceae TaxID=2012 RepID=UPI00255AB75A|nr:MULTISPECIES: leucine-rich repeat domain-containing protein [Thermomonosporaceae]MDL4776658.1 leucine-rich repeat domain-containing protein [Actinomadura xylanilytica]